MYRWIILPTLLVLVTVSAACDDDTVDPPAVEAEYVLELVNGEVPPQVVFENENGQLLVVEGQMALMDDGQYLQQINFEQVLADSKIRTSRICEGSYTLSASELVLTETGCDERVYHATVEDDRVTYEFSTGVEMTWRQVNTTI